MDPSKFILLCLAGWINREQQTVIEYVGHYHRERNHQGLESRIIRPQFRDGGAGEVERRERLGGLLNFYCREAA